MNVNELTLLYTIIDDFFQSFFETILWQNIKCFWLNKRGPKKQLSLSEVVTLNMMRFYVRIIISISIKLPNILQKEEKQVKAGFMDLNYMLFAINQVIWSIYFLLLVMFMIIKL